MPNMTYQVISDIDGQEVVECFVSLLNAMQRFKQLERRVGKDVFSVALWEENRDGVIHRIRNCEDVPGTRIAESLDY